MVLKLAPIFILSVLFVLLVDAGPFPQGMAPHQLLMQVVEPTIIEECFKEANIKKEDLETAVPAPGENPKEAMLCFGKCIMTKEGVLNEDGEISEDKLNEIEVPPEAESKKSEIISCIKSKEPIKECDDMKKFKECFQALAPQ